MKIITMLLVAGILISLIPMVSMNNCPEGDPMGSMKLNCGLSYHCPLCSFIVNATFPERLRLSLIGQLFPTTSLPVANDLARSIFRPPEYRVQRSYSKGMKGFHSV